MGNPEDSIKRTTVYQREMVCTAQFLEEEMRGKINANLYGEQRQHPLEGVFSTDVGSGISGILQRH